MVNDVLSALGVEDPILQLISELIGGPGTFAVVAGIAICATACTTPT